VGSETAIISPAQTVKFTTLCRFCSQANCTDGNAVTSTVHDRMPVILDPDDYDRWLDPGMKDVGAESAMLKPYDARMMRCYPVSNRVNSVANDDEACSAQVELAQIQDRLFDSNPVPKHREARRYEVTVNGHNYPPKYLISIASQRVGRPLKPDEFGGGVETNGFLSRLGFAVHRIADLAVVASPHRQHQSGSRPGHGVTGSVSRFFRIAERFLSPSAPAFRINH
jgi:SOS response associated peptidase (SRAP)